MDRLGALLFCSLVLTCAVHDGAAAAFNGQSVAAGIERTVLATPIIRVAVGCKSPLATSIVARPHSNVLQELRYRRDA